MLYLSCYCRSKFYVKNQTVCRFGWIQDQKLYDSLPEPEDDENDMLDLAFGLTET